MSDPSDITSEYEKDITQYYGDDTVTAIITLRVDTKEVDNVARTICANPAVRDVYLVTGDTDLVMKATFRNYQEFKEFVVGTVGEIKGVMDTSTGMVVSKYKEDRKLVTF
ncbi:MAG: Lrp/AsnC ligand binding domain-containing protein [Thermoplasmata archaeon]|nr:Lrp/AsnC ligand binding domain-containing protein [Thermoplasmata archaeon]